MQKRKCAFIGVFIICCFLNLYPLCETAAAFVDVDHIDLKQGVSYERYLFGGNGIQIEKMFARAKVLRLSDSLRSAVQRIDFPVIFTTYGSITCPDCAIAVPFLELLKNANPQVETLYFTRDNKAREMLLERTGLNRIPTIFITDRSGKILSEHYVEHPRIVYDLLAKSKTEDEKRAHIDEFRAGKYDDDVQSDLSELIDSIF
ncbi:thioredoxin family protein [Synergistaceae bacterium OttesenSCG-928-I11]|nr:thioredoxin family protein [Synergistaceae bacterium OttesenSCG-928-I11]